jgi:hypothetical protein
LAAAQGDNHGLRIAEDAPNPRLGNEARESVEVVELLERGHRPSMTRIPPEGKSGFPRKSGVKSAAKAESYPLESLKIHISTEGKFWLAIPTSSCPSPLKSDKVTPLGPLPVP